MKLAWSDATKMTAHAISSGRPRRCSGTSRAAWAIIAGVFQTSSTPSVSVGPGATALTVIPYFAHSAPRLCVSAVAPALAACVGGHPARAAASSHGGDVDDLARALADHHAADRLREEKHAGEVRRDHRVP